MIIPVSMVGVLSTNVVAAISPFPTDGPEWSDFTVYINSTAQGQVNFTGAEFMALPNITGHATPQGDVRAQFRGVNFSWFAETYADWGNYSAKFIATDGFSVTKQMAEMVNNATHCYILAYEYEGRLMTNQYQLWLIPIAVEPDGDILFAGNVHPRMINQIQIIGTEAQAESERAILMFVIIFSAVVSMIGAALIGFNVYLSRRKKA